MQSNQITAGYGGGRGGGGKKKSELRVKGAPQ